MNRLLALAVVAALCSCGAASASRESPASSCAVAWNLGSTPSLRAAIVAEHPRGAFIDGGGTGVSTIVWSKGQTPTQSSGTGCSIQFVLSGGRTSTVFGAWKNEAITKWVGPVISKPLQIVPPLNTNVHANGTVGFHG
jgi:hypothetical protein